MDLLSINDTPGNYPASWYAASAEIPKPGPCLEGEHRTSVCIIGAGFTGLSTALHLAEAGIDCMVLEAHRIGWGASGRNGGQVGTGFNQGQAELENRFGQGIAKALWDVSTDATGLVRELIDRHTINCDYRPGILYTASSKKYFQALVKNVEHLSKHYPGSDKRVVDSNELKDLLASNSYVGGIIDQQAAQLHPLNYALGLAAAAKKQGAQIFENSRATALNIPFAKSHSAMSGNRVLTDSGSVIADHLVFACNGYLNQLNPEIASRVMPINNYIVATEPLPQSFPDCLIANRMAVCDDRFVVNYFRMSHDNRLLFGGGETWGYQFPQDITGLVRKPLLKVFPQLGSTRIDYAWGGTLAITRSRLPCFGEVSNRVWNASGYSGHGVALASIAGRILSEAIQGNRGELDLMAKLPSGAFPGGTHSRSTLLKLAMAWYATRDRVGL